MNQEQTAKQLLRKRLDIENTSINMINMEALRIFEKLVYLGYSSNVAAYRFRFSLLDASSRHEISLLMHELRMFLYMVAEKSSENAIKLVEDEYGTNNHVDASKLVNIRQYDKTAKERIAIYANRLETEAEKWIMAGIALNLSKNKLAEAFRRGASKPYETDTFHKAVEAEKRLSTLLKRPKRRIGQIGALDSLERLERGLVSYAYREAQKNSFGGNDEIRGYRVVRGSSYPCSLCDSMCGYYTDTLNLPPYHNRCCCIAIPVYRNEIE